MRHPLITINITKCGCKSAAILERLNAMATQADVQALAERVTALGGQLSTAVAGIRQDITDLKAANPTIDLSALEASVLALDAVVDSASVLDAENPVVVEPPVDPEV